MVPESIIINQKNYKNNCDEIYRIDSKIKLTKEEEQRCQLCLRKNELINIKKINENKLNKSWFQLYSGALAGAVARTTVAPIDRIKIIMQTNFVQSNSAQYNTLKGSFSNILKTNGVLGFWKGNGVNCIRVMPHTGIQFASYDVYKALLINQDEQITIPKRLFAGTLAGITAGSFTHPIDIIRIRLQTQPDVKTVKQAIQHVYSEKKMWSFYKGYGPAMSSLGPFIAINFATYDTIKTHINTNYPDQVSKTSNILFMGGTAGLTAQTICYPLDTIRRRSETYGKHYNSILDAIKTIIQKEGIQGFYRGMVANSLKVVPNNFIRFFIFEKINQLFNSENN